MTEAAKVLCTRCGERSQAGAETGDFPTRCQACGALTGPPEGVGAKVVSRPLETVLPGSTIKRGALAAMLSSRRALDRPARAASDKVNGPVSAALNDAAGKAKESSLEVASVQLRQKAVRRAELRGSYQALGLMGAMVLGLAMLVALSAFVLKTRTSWGGNSPSRADVIQIHNN